MHRAVICSLVPRTKICVNSLQSIIPLMPVMYLVFQLHCERMELIRMTQMMALIESAAAPSQSNRVSTDPDDLPIWGIRAIALHINRTEPQTWRLAARGKIPAVKIGGMYMTTRRRLRNMGLEPAEEGAA